MREAAQKAQELQRQAEAARTTLNEAAAKVHELEQQAAAAQKTITLFQEQEGVIATALQDAQRTSDDLMRAAKARADETLAAAKSAAEGIVQSARTAAGETLQKARASAQEQIHAAERTAAAAKAAADETLQKARASAQEQIHAAERTAAEHLTRLRAESDQLAEESTRKVQEVRQAAEQYLTGITAKLDAFIRDREQLSRGLEAMARNHAESLQIMTRLRSEVQAQILPALHRLVHRLKGEEAGGTEDTAPLPVSAGEPSEAKPAVASDEPRGTAAEASEVSAEASAEASVPAVRYQGEIIVSPIHSFLQATKFMTALSQIHGVASVKLRTYSGAKATIEVVTEGHTLAGINCKAIDGFSVEVVESTATHLALRIGSPAARPVPG